MTVIEDTMGARVAARTRNMKSSSNYREKEVDDMTADILDSEDDDSKKGNDKNDDAPVWLQDDVRSDEDIELNSEDDSDTEAIQAQMVDTLSKDTKSEQSSLDTELSEMDTKTVSLKLKKLNEFVRQSQVYSSIIADTLLQKSNEVANSNIKDGDDISSQEQPSKRHKTKKKSITDFFKKQKMCIRDRSRSSNASSSCSPSFSFSFSISFLLWFSLPLRLFRLFIMSF